MAIDKTIKSNRLLQSKRYTQAALTDAQEAFTSVLDINSKEVYAQSSLLPTSSLPFSGSSQNGSIYSVGGQNLLKYWYQHTLTPSNVVSASLVDAWFFINPSASSVTPQIVQSGQVTDFISNKYASPALSSADAQDNPPGYSIVVLVDNVKQNSANYQFDYKDGVLQFNTSAPTSAQVVKITAYQYIGQTVDTVLTNLSSSIAAVSSSVSNLSSNKITTGTVTASVASGSTSFLVESSSVALFSVSNTGVISGSTLIVSTISASNALVTDTITANNITAVSASFGYVTTISGSAVIIGQEYIVLNTQTPAARFAGLQIYDSGSLATSSIVWDSQANHFVYQNASGSVYSGGGFLAGPRNTGSLGNEIYPTQYRVIRSQGDDHVYDSNIIDNDTAIKLGINTEITGTLSIKDSAASLQILGNGFGQTSFTSTTGAIIFTPGYGGVNINGANPSLTVDGNITSTGANSYLTGSLLGTASYANQALTASYALNSTSASYALNSTSASYALSASNADLLDGIDSTNFVQTSTAQTITGNKSFRDTTFFGTNSADGKITFVEQTGGLSASIAIDAEANLIIQNAGDTTFVTIYQNGDGIELASGTFTGNLTGTANTASFVTGSNVYGPYGANSVITASYAIAAATASYVVGLNLYQISTGSITASVSIDSPTAFSITSASVSLFNVSTSSLVTIKNLTISDNLVVNGTASFINSENLLVKDPFILINSGSANLTDSGIISQYNSSGEGSAIYIEATDTGTYGRWAVAYGVQQGFVSVTADEYMVTAKKASGTPPATPTWGGTTNGFGNIYVNSDNGEIFIYS